MNFTTNHTVLHAGTTVKDITLPCGLTCGVISHEAEKHANTQGSFSPNYNHGGNIFCSSVACRFPTSVSQSDQVLITNSKLNKPKLYSSTNDRFSF